MPGKMDSFKALSAHDKRHAVVNWLLDHAMIIIILLLAVFVHPATYWQLIPPGLLFVAVYAASMWLFGMNRYERGLVTGPLRRILHRQ